MTYLLYILLAAAIFGLLLFSAWAFRNGIFDRFVVMVQIVIVAAIGFILKLIEVI